jgi:hypothetical protein
LTIAGSSFRKWPPPNNLISVRCRNRVNPSQPVASDIVGALLGCRRYLTLPSMNNVGFEIRASGTKAAHES